MSWVGIDVSKATLDVVGLNEQRQTQHTQVDNRASGYAKLKRWLGKRSVQAVCLAATGRYREGVAESVHQAGDRVSVVNPARLRGYATSQLRRNKTDKLDATLIADFCRTQQPEAWTPAPPEVRQLQALVRHLTTLEEAKQQADNRLREAVQQLKSQRALLVAQIDQLKGVIQDHMDHFPDLRNQRDRMAAIPGIGKLTAAKLLAECRSVSRFDDVRQLVAFAGLNPAHHQSGSSLRQKTTLSQTGNSAIRAALYMPAVSAKRHNPVLRPFAQRLFARGCCEMEVITAVMRKLLQLVEGVLKSGRPFDPHFQNAS